MNMLIEKYHPPWVRVWLGIRRRILSGILLLVPLAVTVFVLSLILRGTIGVLLPVLRPLTGDLPLFVVLPLALVVLVVGLYLVGSLASHVIGRKLITYGEWMVSLVPFVKTIYSASKKVIDTFVELPEGGRKQVVLVNFPSPELRAFGFVTGRIITPDGVDCFKVFIPTTPNPTTGFLQLTPVATTPVLDLSPEEAISLIMSGGIMAPDRLTASYLVSGKDDLPPIHPE